MAFQLPHLYDFVNKLCGQRTRVIQSHENALFPIMDKAKPATENIRGLNLAATKHTAVQVTKLSL
jgi:hypothetical protein